MTRSIAAAAGPLTSAVRVRNESAYGYAGRCFMQIGHDTQLFTCPHFDGHARFAIERRAEQREHVFASAQREVATRRDSKRSAIHVHLRPG